MLQPTQLLPDKKKEIRKNLNVTVHKKLKSPALCSTGFGQTHWQNVSPKPWQTSRVFQPTNWLWTSLAISYRGGHLVMPLTDGQRQTVIGCQGLLCLKRKEEELERRPAINNQPARWKKSLVMTATLARAKKKKKPQSKPNPLRTAVTSASCLMHGGQSHQLMAAPLPVCVGVKFLPDVLNTLCWWVTVMCCWASSISYHHTSIIKLALLTVVLIDGGPFTSSLPLFSSAFSFHVKLLPIKLNTI